MKILIIGNGGREHALAWKAAQSPQVAKVFVAPGNAGTAQEMKVENIPIGASDIASLIKFVQEQAIGLTLVGPEAPLVAGIVDQFQQVGLPCLGPSQAAAQLEGSKAFMKAFLTRHRIPTADYQTFTQLEPAIAYIRQQHFPLVIKADGLAAGKGVIIVQTEADAIATAESFLSGQTFGVAGQRIVIEEFLGGEEASFTCLVDGEHILPLATSQDHKARDEGDKGPNTGGMGAYSPAPVITPSLHERIMTEIIQPTVQGMADDGYPYTGLLYAGLMIDEQGTPKVLEYNCRLGDPETQPLMLRLRSDLISLCQATLEKRLDQITVDWHEETALGVVLAAGGYPDDYQKGLKINGLAEAATLAKTLPGKIFQAGTQQQGDSVVTAGGRVLCACALGNTVGEAQQKAYTLVEQIHWEGMYYRRDIGHRAI